MALGPAPLHSIHYLVTLIDIDPPAIFDLVATPDEDGWCVVVTPVSGRPPFDFFVLGAGSAFLQFLNKMVDTAL